MTAQFLEQNKPINVSVYTAAGTSTITTSVVDMQGYEEATFLVTLGTVTDASVLTLTTKQNSASSTSSPTPLSITNGSVALTASTSSATMMAVNVVRPSLRYVYATLARATQNAEVGSIVCILSKPYNVPVTADTSLAASKIAVAGN